MKKIFAGIGAAAAVFTASVPAAFAGAPSLMEMRNDQGEPMLQQARHYRRRYARDGYSGNYACAASNRRSNNQGTVLGAVAGGVGGNLLAGGGNRTLGTVLGAGVGAVAGNQIARRRNSC